MKVTVLGCSGSFAGPNSPASSYLVTVPAPHSPDHREWNVVLDMGNGSLGALQSEMDPRKVDAIAISHLHPDHFVDLAGLYVYLRYHPAGPGGTPIPVWGPPGTAQRVGAVYGLEPTESMAAHLDIRPWPTDGTLTVGPLTINVKLVDHPVPAYGMRLTGPSDRDPKRHATIAYTGDTDLCEAATTLSHDADLLIAEAAFIEGRDDHVGRGIHMTGRRAGQLAARARARKLVLTHLPAWNDPAVSRTEAVSAYDGPLEVAEPGSTYVV